MKRFAPYIGILTALAFFVLIVVAAADQPAVLQTPAPATPTASSTVAAEPTAIIPPITVPIIAPATSSPVAQKPPVPKKVAPPPVPVPVAAPILVPVQPSVAETNAALDASASLLRAALVNILCYVPVGSGLHSISGSGVFIDSKGIILTNAHVAQYFLLKDKGAHCTIRMGSPAADRYDAALIYISPLWLRANASVLTTTLPSGTGEYDFALLAVSKSATANALPASFPSIPLAVTPPNIDAPIVIATYGAQFLETNQIQSGLFPTIVFGSVKDIFTFKTSTIDVLALGGSVAAQEGSSGGGVSDVAGNLAGTITTSTVTGDTSTRSLDAITASYIRAEYASEMGSALDLLLAEPTEFAISDFAPQIPALEKIITASLP